MGRVQPLTSTSLNTGSIPLSNRRYCSCSLHGKLLNIKCVVETQSRHVNLFLHYIFAKKCQCVRVVYHCRQQCLTIYINRKCKQFPLKEQNFLSPVKLHHQYDLLSNLSCCVSISTCNVFMYVSVSASCPDTDGCS